MSGLVTWIMFIAIFLAAGIVSPVLRRRPVRVPLAPKINRSPSERRLPPELH